jgi:subtilase family protein
MSRRSRSRSSLLIAAFFGALAALLTPAAAAGAAETVSLSPALATLSEPHVAAKSVAGQDAAIGLAASGPGSLERIGDSVIVEAHFDSGAIAAIPAVKEAGARVIDAGRRYQALALAIDPEDLDSLAGVPGVRALTAAITPRVSAVGGAGTAAIQSNGLCEGGSVITQGLGQLKVDLARAAFGTRGAGETIAVLSDSFNSAGPQNGNPVPTHAHEDEVTNDLPGPASTCSGQQIPVDVLAEAQPGLESSQYSDEGRAMLGVIHDLAPHAKLAFATGTPTELSYALNIEKLAAPVSSGGAGADVIVDDLSYQTEPYFQDGPVAVAIKRVTEKGVLYFSAAANENLFNSADEEISSWEAPGFRPSAECPGAVTGFLTGELTKEGKGPYEPECMDFKQGVGVDTEFGITVERESPLSLFLQWAEPRFGVRSDLFGFLVTGPKGSESILDESGANELGPEPVLGLEWENEAASEREVRLVIARCGGTCNPDAEKPNDVPLKFQFAEDGPGVADTEYPKHKVELEGSEDTVGPTIYGHDGSAAVNTIAAVNWAESNTAPIAPEPYSSRGPVTHYFGPVEGTIPAAKLAKPEVISKPDMTATDCASTTFFGEFVSGVGWEFCGTSEAAEHAATIAALMQQANPLATPGQIAGAMKSTATKFTVVKSPFDVGAGMVNALAATTAVSGTAVYDPPSYVVPSLEEEEKAGPPTVTITKGPPALGKENRPIFQFASNRPVAFTCQIDGGTPQACASPYVVPSVLGDGTHGFVVIGTDAQGRKGSSGIYSFTVDTKAPKTTIVGHPKKVVKTKKKTVAVRFRLKANESPVTFYCQIDKEPLRICGRSFSHRFTKGKHALRVRAKDEAGNLAEKQTVFHFRVKQIRQKPRH